MNRNSKRLFNLIMIIGGLLTMASGLCYGVYFDHKKEVFTNYQKSFGGAKFVEHCFKNGVNLIDEETKVSLLHIAASEGWVEVVDRLITNGADVNLRAKYGETPLHVAVDDGQIDVVRYLITKDANVDNVVSFEPGFRHSSPLVVAVDKGLFEMAETLLSVKPNLNSQFDLAWSNSEKPSGHKFRYSLLGIAIQRGDIKMIDLLISSGADVNNIGEEDGYQLTPLELTIKGVLSAINKEDYEKQMKIMEMLILAGSDVNKQSIKAGVMVAPLYLAVIDNNLDLAEMLIKAHADVNQMININGNTYSLLQIANTYKFSEMVQLLINSGAKKGLKTFLLRDGKLDEIEL